VVDLVNDDDVLHARVVINDASLLTAAGRETLSAWLRSQADSLEKEGHNYAARYSATYHTPAKINASLG
jgi:hypothetical protein